MKAILIISIAISLFSCKKALVPHTENNAPAIPWADSSSKHPKKLQFKNLLDKYTKKGLPGISLLVNDASGTWVGSAGKADIEKNVPFMPGTVSKAASITKFIMGTLVFKLIEDSVHTGVYKL
jgi:D-alanyl-D-alanine carboxypeptidase